MTFLHVLIESGFSALAEVGDRVLPLFQIREPFRILVPQRVVDSSWRKVIVHSLDGARFGRLVGVPNGPSFLIRRFKVKNRQTPELRTIGPDIGDAIFP